MPVKKAAYKDLRQSKKRAERNKLVKNQLKKLTKVIRKKIDAGDQKELDANIKKIIKLLDKAAQKKIIKKNTAARKKSRLVKKANKLINKK